MRLAACFLLSVFLSFASSPTHASDPSPLQDFCVAIVNNPPVFVNGFVCKNPATVQAADFFYTGLNIPGNTTNSLGLAINRIFVNVVPGLNTLGISLARVDFAANGENAPHLHPRASEMLIVIQGTLFAGFVTSNQDGNRLFTKTLQVGDVFVIPRGLIHFQANVGNTNAVAIAFFSSQFPGVVTVANSVFGSNPPISDLILAKAFQVDNGVIDLLKAQFK